MPLARLRPNGLRNVSTMLYRLVVGAGSRCFMEEVLTRHLRYPLPESESFPMAHAADVARALRDEFDFDQGTVKIHKLLYYCQAWHVTWTGQPLFEEPIEAWDMGPVVADLWRSEKYEEAGWGQEEPLDPVEMRTVKYVVSRYGKKWAKQLIGQTHAERPWRDAHQKARNTVIPLESMRDFFREDEAADQAWFWDDDWHEGERQADRDIREGRTEVFLDADDFLKSL